MFKKILLIDDDPGILEAIKFFLEDEGFKVSASEKPEIAERLLSLKKNLPDLIILDVLLSGNDGRQICKKLKSNKTTRGIPVVMISAHPSARESSIESGADAFIEKPFDIDKFITVIEKKISP